MNKVFKVLFLSLLLFSAKPVFAQDTTDVGGIEMQEDGVFQGRARKLNATTGLDVDCTARTCSMAVQDNSIGPTQIDETANYSWSGTQNFDEVKIDTTTCIDSNGADRLFHDTDCDGAKDGNEEYIDQTGLNDGECGNGQIYKKSGGTWQCGTDADSGSGLNIDRVLWVTTGGVDAPGTLNAECVGSGDPHTCCTGAGTGTCEDCSTEACCTLSNPCATVQQAINEATELSPPVSGWKPAMIRVAAGTYDEKNIKLRNTDSGSSRFLMTASGLAIQGDGQITTIIGPSSFVTDDCVVDGTGAYSVKIKNLSLAVTGGYGRAVICSNGGMRGWELYDLDTPVGIASHVRAMDLRGSGNATMEFYRWRPFDYFTPEGRQVSVQAGNTGSGEGFCASYSDGVGYGACLNNADCGGVCGPLATNAIEFCANNTDCDGDTCVSGECTTYGTDYLIRNSLLQSSRAGWVFEYIRTCDGGATLNLTGSVEVDFDAQCSTGTCDAEFTTEASTLVCNTNADCQRYVVGTGTDFDGADNIANTADDAVPVGERIIVDPLSSPQTKTVRKVISATILEVSDEFTAKDAASLNFRRTDDGWQCDTNSDCASGGSTGVCTTGGAGTLQKRFVDTMFFTDNSGGECRDANGQPDVPPVGCDANGDCSGGDTCISASLIVDGDFDVQLEDSLVTTSIGAYPPDYEIVATGSANVTTKHSAYSAANTLEKLGGTIIATSTGSFNGILLEGFSLTSPGCSSAYDGLMVADPATGSHCVCNDNAIPATYTWCPVGNPSCTDGTGTTCGTYQGYGSGDFQASNGGNFVGVLDDDNDGAETPFAGTAGMFAIGDIDETATDNYCAFKDVTKAFCFPASQSTTNTDALFASPSGIATYRGILDADVPNTITIDNAGAVEGTDLGALEDAKWCAYDLTGTEIDCNVTPVVDTDDQTCGEVSGADCSTTNEIEAEDTAFPTGWDADTSHVPTQNAVYDYAHLADTDDDGFPNKIDLGECADDGDKIETDANGVLSCGVLPAGSSKWTDSGANGVLYQNDTTDEIVIGASATQGAKLAVKGDADEVQQRIIANETQTANLSEWRNSANSSNYAYVDPDGDAYFNSISTPNYEASNGGNYIFVNDDDDSNGTVFGGILDSFSIGDTNQTGATDNYCAYIDQTKSFCFPASQSSTNTDALFANPSGIAVYRGILDADVPNNITVDLATVATTANAGDSATAFFSSGEIADAQISDTLTASTSTSASNDDNDTSIATTAFVQQEIKDAGDDGRSLTGAATGVINADVETYRDTKCVTIETPAATDWITMFRAETALVVTGIDCIVMDGTSVVVDVEECSGTNAATVDAQVEASITCGTTNTTEATSIDNPNIEAGDYIRLDLGTNTGTVTQLTVCVTFEYAD